LLGIGNLTNPVFRDNFMTARNTLNACADVTNVRLETRTGNISSLNRYLNTRFGLYDNPVRGDGFPSDTFVRKGFNMTNGCSGSVDGAFRSMLETNAYLPSAFNTTTWRFNGTNIGAMGYPANYTMSPIGTTFIGGQTAPAGTSYVWPYDYYLRFNYPTRAAAILGDPAELPPQSYPAADAVRNPNVLTPSRHDVYLYELANRATLGNAVRGNDSPNPSCSGEPVEAGARYMYLALADCAATPPTGTSVALEVIAYAKIFLTNPVISSSANEIYGEVIDLSNRGVGLTDVEYRDEAFLVR
ncbi:MAG TPA: hypothetical protein VLA78_08720, partial [Paracoccaceae bacterium]|nr:hypothetical protein [Paracoccaceae bacterium]